MTIEAVNAFKRASSVLRARLPLIGSKWADANFYLSPESSGTEGRWRCYPYQVAWLNWMTCDDIEEVNFQKSRRVGYTKCLLAATGCLIEQKFRNIAIWHPTDGDARDFVTDEVETALRDIPAFGRKLKCSVGAKSKYNTLQKKVFLGAILDIKGGKSARNFRRMTKDVAIYDETDGFDVDIEGEGNCFELGDGRLDQAPFPKSIRGSTPKTKGLSLIETAVENSDMIFFRFVRCPDCGVLQRLEFSHLKWENRDPESVYYRCVTGCRLEYRHYSSMDANGRWQTLDGYYYSDKSDQFYNPADQLIPKPRRIGVRIWAAYSYLRPWSYLVDRWLAAKKNQKSGNVTTLKTVINTLLGETFEEQGETVNSSALGSRCEDYLKDGTIPDGVLVVTCGVDVQGGANARLELEIVGYGLEGESWSLDYVVLAGDPARKEVWEQLDAQLDRIFSRIDGVAIGIACTFIDSGYLATSVYRFTAPRRRRNIYATKGVNTGTICNKGTWQGDKGKKSRCILRTVNVDDTKTIIFNRLQIEKPGPGYSHFPLHYTDKHFEQLTNAEKIEKRKKGVLLGFDWIKTGPDEQLDCRGYSLAALEYLNPNMERVKLRHEQAALSAGADRPSAKIEKKRPPRQQGRPKKGFVSAWK